jgi:hypothetical protein
MICGRAFMMVNIKQESRFPDEREKGGEKGTE